MVYSMVDEDIYSEGAKTNRIYYLKVAENKRTEKEIKKKQSQHAQYKIVTHY